MLRKESDNFMNRVRHALSLPIRTRCAELNVLFDRGSTLDLQNFFPLLIDSIFGPNGSLSWGLRTPRCVNEDFTQLEHFLSPSGPVFKLIYLLLKDPSAKYDFPVSYLPLKVQQILENAHNHPFYADLVHVNPTTKHVISLLLNPFDYYMFHFAYHLINPWHQRSSSVNMPAAAASAASWNTVYYVLCCDYMLHFLPTNPSTPVLPVIFYNGKSPLQQLQPMHKSPMGSKLIHSSLMNKSREEYTFHHNHQSFGRHPRNEIWRSETVLTVFIDMWLNNDQISQLNTQINNSFNASPIPRLLQYCELPTSEYMRIVRVLVKQLHSFSASAKIDDSHMSDLKKIAIPMLESKFYIFLRNLVHKWPLDGSFRLLLELWLTYIQPWRYPPDTTSKKPASNDLDENVFHIDREYLPFIAENLLSYVVILQQLLPRFARVDLVSPKMSVMLYRISKVFSQPNLANFLQEIEQCVENNHSPSHSFNSHWLSALPPLNPTAGWCTNTANIWNSTTNESFNTSHKVNFDASASVNTTFMNSLLGDKKWSAVVKQRIYEVEGSAFCYKALFTSPPAPEVYDLIMQIKRSIKVAQELVEIKQQEEQELYASFSGLFKSLFSAPKTNDEFSLTERLKVPEYLNKSLENLMGIFRITQLPESEPEVLNGSGGGGGGVSSSDFDMTNNDFSFLTPQKVRERMKRIKYEGDPDLHPIRTTEVAVLVRMFYQISLQINENFQQKFCQLYYDPSYWGRLSRQFLAQPLTVYRYDKSKPGSPRVSVNLPPRISLRCFSTYQFMGYFLFGSLCFYLIGYNMSIYLVFLLVVCVLYKMVKAVSGSATPSAMRHNYPTQGFGNISFDDSF